MKSTKGSKGSGRRFGLTTLAAGAILCLAGLRAAFPQGEDDRLIADRLAAMLRAGRAVVSESQDLINDPKPGPKGLDGRSVLARSVAKFRAATGVDPGTIDPASRQGRLLRDEMDAIRDVMDANQASIDAPGVGFKGFIPAVFARLVSEDFSQRANGDAQMKVTAPLHLVRNRKARPDAWEAEVIDTHFLKPDWPVGQPFEEVTKANGRPVYRMAVPERYATSCLTCHGGPKGELDITGYPKEGAAIDDLGGVISITLKH